MVERMADSLSSIVFFRKDLSQKELLEVSFLFCFNFIYSYLGMRQTRNFFIKFLSNCLIFRVSSSRIPLPWHGRARHPFNRQKY